MQREIKAEIADSEIQGLLDQMLDLLEKIHTACAERQQGFVSVNKMEYLTEGDPDVHNGEFAVISKADSVTAIVCYNEGEIAAKLRETTDSHLALSEPANKLKI